MTTRQGVCKLHVVRLHHLEIGKGTATKIEIESNVVKYYLRDAYFITGTAYAGKSTMVKMLSEKYDMVFCGENYHGVFPSDLLTPEKQPNLCYFRTMSGWQEFLSRTPEEYERWIFGGADEATGIEIAELLKRSAAGKKMIIDTNIPLSVLREISDYNHVAVMLSPQYMSVERFFDRADPEKQFLLRQIGLSEHPAKTMANFRECIARLNSPEHYAELLNSGFYTIIREDSAADTRQEILARLADHFGLEG